MAVKTKTQKAVTMFQCNCCGQELREDNFYNSPSVFHHGKVPVCKGCIKKLYDYYCAKYKDSGSKSPEKDSIKRLCMGLDVYYNESNYEKALASLTKDKVVPSLSLCTEYFRKSSLSQNSKKTYDNTIFKNDDISTQETSENGNEVVIPQKTIKFFGKGFSDEDYIFLQDQYDDWTARHECNTKSQEEVFKQICFAQLKISKAEQKGEDTKDLNTTFLKLLEAAKLQPKQNSGDTVSEAQTFGTLIEKWETTKPIPEVDPDLKDVDKIGLYLDVFFRGHLAKMMGLKNGLSNLYSKFMKKYTVERPEYDSDEDSEVLFDSIFGNQTLDDN